jgi:hypothetical protein
MLVLNSLKWDFKKFRKKLKVKSTANLEYSRIAHFLAYNIFSEHYFKSHFKKFELSIKFFVCTKILMKKKFLSYL